MQGRGTGCEILDSNNIFLDALAFSRESIVMRKEIKVAAEHQSEVVENLPGTVENEW